FGFDPECVKKLVRLSCQCKLLSYLTEEAKSHIVRAHFYSRWGWPTSLKFPRTPRPVSRATLQLCRPTQEEACLRPIRVHLRNCFRLGRVNILCDRCLLAKKT